MPGTRAQSRGKAVGGTSDSAAGNSPADLDHGLSADSEVTNQQGNMSDVVPKDLQDSHPALESQRDLCKEGFGQHYS